MKIQNDQNQNVSFKAFLWKKEYDALKPMAERAVKGIFLEEPEHLNLLTHLTHEQKLGLKKSLSAKGADSLLLTQSESEKLIDINEKFKIKRPYALKNSDAVKIAGMANDSASTVIEGFVKNAVEIPFEKYKEWSKIFDKTMTKLADDFGETFKDKLY